ncbi:hypothetical protein [Leptolyngbya iicbica]|nr:hypothetical protein [Leptolyngbya sp. LK]
MSKSDRVIEVLPSEPPTNRDECGVNDRLEVQNLLPMLEVRRVL